MCTVEKDGMRENLPSAVSASQACEECVNPQTEREKIGHFHIYSSVRSRAVYREKQGGREEERKEGCNHRNSEVSQAFLFPICELAHSPLPAWTHNKGKQKKGGKNEKV